MPPARKGAAGAFLLAAVACGDSVSDPIPPHTVRVELAGDGLGTETSQPAEISCSSEGGPCSAQFEEGAALGLSAAPSTESDFMSWAGSCSGSGACALTVSAFAQVRATFDDPQTETRTVGSAGGIVSSPDGGVNLTFPPGALSQSVECIPVPMKTLTVTTSGEGSGTVTSSPTGIGCPPTCSAEPDGPPGLPRLGLDPRSVNHTNGVVTSGTQDMGLLDAMGANAGAVPVAFVSPAFVGFGPDRFGLGRNGSLMVAGEAGSFPDGFPTTGDQVLEICGVGNTEERQVRLRRYNSLGALTSEEILSVLNSCATAQAAFAVELVLLSAGFADFSLAFLSRAPEP